MVVSGHRNQSSGPGLCWGGWEREDSQNASALSAGERRLAARWAALADPPRRLFARLFRRAAAASGGVTREAAAAYPEIDVPAAAAALVGSGLAARPGWRGAAAVVPALRLAELRDAARRAAPDGPALAALGRAALVDRLLAALPPPSPGGGITVQPLPPPPPVAPPVTPDRGGAAAGAPDVDAVVTGREWAAAVALGGVAEAELRRFWRPAGWGEGWEEEGGDDGDDNEDNNDNHMDDADDSDVDATFMGFVGRGLDVDGDKFKEEPPSTSLHATRR
ncbi:hypothetical protein I4F81_011157 [Pyropia yezoensis]|uniref:Uncharacterized protein n=1 Tax=Pyropia yezoensis TaxID=2788 RepID=A0ACC3CF09_PYRYE|nr:hypothetical protein I4F81_011157 [Neopyropia yezoensis]